MFGAYPSTKDRRTVKHAEMTTMTGLLVPRAGVKYKPEDIEHQHKVGICTAISLTQNARKAIGRKFSADFQYLCQKKYYDYAWYEGSSILNALKVGKNIGFLPEEYFCDSKSRPYITENDRELNYADYTAKLKAIPDSEIERFKKLASDYKLDGYAQVDATDRFAIAKAINDSKSGVLCMYHVGEEWYTAPNGIVTWLSKYINPLRPPKKVISGHAITAQYYDYTINVDLELANTWGNGWCNKGCANAMFTYYPPREVWIPYYGMTEEQIQELRKKLSEQTKSLALQIIDLLKKKISFFR